MNFSASTQRGSHISKENLPPSSKTDALPVQRAKQRTVLGVLSENEQRGRPFSQVSERGEVERMKWVCFFYYFQFIHFPSQHIHTSTSCGNHCIFRHREANFPNAVHLLSPSSAVHPVPAMMCTWKRLVKLFLPLLVKKCSQAAIT